MRRSLIALSAALALAGGTAFAQQQKEQPGVTKSAQDSQSSGGSITERFKATMRRIGEKTRAVAGKAKDKTEQTAHKAKDDSDDKSAQSGSSTRSMGAAGDTSTSDSDRQKRMDEAYKDSQKAGHSSSSSSTSR